MSDDTFIPQVGYRGLKFGMSVTEAARLLGPEVASTDVTTDFDDDPEEAAYIDGRVSKTFEGYPPFHDIMELTFKNDRLVEIHIQESKAQILFRGIDLFSEDRKAVVDQLFELDPDLYGNREAGFFGELGIVVTWPSVNLPGYYIQFVDSEDIWDGGLDFRVLDPLDEPLK